ncbi:TPA: hypothetical protein H1005_01405 [archaeon]|nr:hypothetical protein [Candidatus Naiadarchaeales archaeon SRR2090153.bin1042]
MTQDDLSKFLDSSKSREKKGAEKVFKEWEFQQPAEEEEKELPEAAEEEVPAQTNPASEIIKEAIGDVGEKTEGEATAEISQGESSDPTDRRGVGEPAWFPAEEGRAKPVEKPWVSKAVWVTDF